MNEMVCGRGNKVHTVARFSGALRSSTSGLSKSKSGVSRMWQKSMASWVGEVAWMASMVICGRSEWKCGSLDQGRSVRLMQWAIIYAIKHTRSDPTRRPCPLLVNTFHRLSCQSQNNHPYTSCLPLKVPCIQCSAEGLPHIGSETGCATDGWLNFCQCAWSWNPENYIPAFGQAQAGSHGNRPCM